jgi:hypothetical protein
MYACGEREGRSGMNEMITFENSGGDLSLLCYLSIKGGGRRIIGILLVTIMGGYYLSISMMIMNDEKDHDGDDST